MSLEVIAAVLVGLAAIAIILAPMASAARPRPPIADLEELEETPKGIALTALREIEFDKATGKLSEEDYLSLKAKYSAAALALLKSEEANAPPPGDVPDRVEAMIDARVRALTTRGAIACPRCGPRPESDAAFCSSCGDRLPGTTLCPVCGSGVPSGARFCEGCGSAVAA